MPCPGTLRRLPAGPHRSQVNRTGRRARLRLQADRMTLLDAIAHASQRAEGNGGKTDLAKLATRIQDDLIMRNQGEDYAAHHIITQLLLLAVGPFSFERVEIIRGDVLSRNRDRDKPSFSDEHST